MARTIKLLSALALAALSSVAGLAAAVTPAAAAAAPPATHTLSVQIAGNGSGKLSGSSIDCWAADGKPNGPCTVTEVSGNSITLTAVADKGSVFAGWSGGGCSGTGACTVVLNSDTTLFAKFVLASVSAGSGPLAISRSHRTALLPMTCHGPGACYGSVQLSAKSKGSTLRLATARYTISPGRSTKLRLGFSSGTIALLATNHNRLRATLTITPIDGQTKNSPVTLTLA